MKERKIIIGLIIFNLITISIIFNLLVNRTINHEKQIIKQMTATEYENSITALNTAHENYANQIQNCKNKIAEALTKEGVTTSNNLDLEVMSENIPKILEARTRNATAVAENILQGKTAYVAGQLITGTAKNPEEQYNQGFIDGQKNATSNLKIQYTYHKHTGSASTTANGCYTAPKYHTHISSCYTTCTGRMIAVEQGYESGQYYSNGDPIYKALARCSSCGRTAYDLGVAKHWVGQPLGQCNSSILKCTKTTSTIESYTLGCGKTEETVESATIIY